MLRQVDVAPVRVEEYGQLIGDQALAQLRALAEPLRGARILHVNATPYGGGVSELLRSTVAIQRGLGLDIEWRVISGDASFFEVTKAVHNALQGASWTFTPEAQETWLLQNAHNAADLGEGYDLIVVHDPQPAGLLHFHGHGNARWVWRCHIDTSDPNPQVLSVLLPYIQEYDALVFTMEQFVPAALRGQHIHIIPPAIDPLSPKNIDLPDRLCERIITWVGVDPQRPIMTQVSRFDPWKDPLGVLRIYRRAREEVPGLQLALLGSLALDDPEAWELLRQVHDAAGDDQDITIATNLTGIGNIEVNVFQRRSDVVVQKSLREGFGLIVSETLWKGTAMVAGNTGGIPLQMPNGAGGVLVDPRDEDAFAAAVVRLLRHPEERRALGARGREVVRERFLITRLVADELALLGELAAGVAAR